MTGLQRTVQIFFKHGSQNKADNQRCVGQLECFQEKPDQSENQYSLYIKHPVVTGKCPHTAHNHDNGQQNAFRNIQQLCKNRQSQSFKDKHKNRGDG